MPKSISKKGYAEKLKKLMFGEDIGNKTDGEILKEHFDKKGKLFWEGEELIIKEEAK